MKIAVTYDQEQIFPHFGKSEAFKLYDIADGVILAASVVGTDGQGHGALAGFLRSHAVDAVICGGIGEGAQQALQDAGITCYNGTSGSCDAAVQKLLDGQLAANDRQALCRHHEHTDGHGCRHD